MEFDNDRLIKKHPRTELFLWSLLALINTVVNGLIFFHNDIAMWLGLLLVNMAVLPLYVLFANWVFGKFFFRKKKWSFVLLSVATILVLHVALLLLHLFLQLLPLSPPKAAFFHISPATIGRETIWILVNLCLSAGIHFILATFDKKDIIDGLQRENNYLRLRYLRSQLNPHFLFNTLNSIYALSLQQSDQAPEAVIKLADIMRYLIYECNEDKIALDKEIEFIRNYIAIEAIRFNADIQFDVEGETAGVMIEPFLFISFIENGFKHALDNTDIKPFIYITVKVRAQEIVLNVINNTNIDLETQAKRLNGKGISGSKNLLELLYPASYQLNIIQTDKDEGQENKLRMKFAKDRLENLYPDAHTLDVILKNNVFTVSLIIKQAA
ncbi:MAG TPA: sensor histidine kinase [Panacibacter sp.]|nr:sensor histidine kinase [Panacibacter sp.]HNP46165.1 sensor histidine kinase [Panacibacter sp.]